jgi:hypothetical protein
MKNSVFAGWLLQRTLTKGWTLGREIYHAEAQQIGGIQATFLDAGGYYNLREDLSVLFMAGHTVAVRSTPDCPDKYEERRGNDLKKTVVKAKGANYASFVLGPLTTPAQRLTSTPNGG